MSFCVVFNGASFTCDHHMLNAEPPFSVLVCKRELLVRAVALDILFPFLPPCTIPVHMNSCRYVQYYIEGATYRREWETVVVHMTSILCILLACNMVWHPVQVYTASVCV